MKLQKRLAGQILKCGPKRIRFDTSKLEEIKSAITNFDVKKLIEKGAIIKIQKKGTSRAKAKEKLAQKQKGRRKGHGSRKGTKKTRVNEKESWINTVRLQRRYLSHLKRKKLINNIDWRIIYDKIRGGFFRSLGHLKLYIEERGITKKE